jgi:hypothetical protein
MGGRRAPVGFGDSALCFGDGFGGSRAIGLAEVDMGVGSTERDLYLDRFGRESA